MSSLEPDVNKDSAELVDRNEGITRNREMIRPKRKSMDKLIAQHGKNLTEADAFNSNVRTRHPVLQWPSFKKMDNGYGARIPSTKMNWYT